MSPDAASNRPASVRAPRRILAVGAHPDDVEFGCGGILAKERALGHKVTILNLSGGEAASSGDPATRRHEAEAAAQVLGARVEFLELQGDARLEYGPANAIAVARVIRRVRPHVLLAPAPEENQHPDHAKAGRLVRDAARLARYAGLSDLAPAAPHAIEALYFYEITGTGVASSAAGAPAIVVDVSEVLATWRSAMECHASQLATRNYVELQLARARALGLGVGVEHAIAVRGNDPILLGALTELGASGRRF